MLQLTAFAPSGTGSPSAPAMAFDGGPGTCLILSGQQAAPLRRWPSGRTYRIDSSQRAMSSLFSSNSATTSGVRFKI